MKRLLFIFAVLLFDVSAFAQGDVLINVVEIDNKNTVFSVEASAIKSDEVVSTALDALFHALLDDGIEGVNSGNRLMNVENTKWKTTFFKSKNPPYMAYVKGYQTEGEPIKNAVGKYQTTVLVRVNIEFLIRQLKAYGVMK